MGLIKHVAPQQVAQTYRQKTNAYERQTESSVPPEVFFRFHIQEVPEKRSGRLRRVFSAARWARHLATSA